jgi:LPXTG-site transpeptidase (sortase) family protein
MKNLQTVFDDIMAQKLQFLAAFFCIFTLSYGILYALDFYPEPIATDTEAVTATTTVVEEPKKATTTAVATIDPADTLPLSITIDALDRTVKVLNPASNSVEAMDSALLNGVIRHPDSATFAEEGNMFIMGHSSYLPTVHNRNFQAFNGIQNLKWGDTVTLESKNVEYTYKVEKTYKVKASGYTVPVAGKGKTLTLVTCNSFGSTEDRYVVEATLVSTKALAR